MSKKRRSNNPAPISSPGTQVYARVSRDASGFAYPGDTASAELIASHLSDLILSHSLYDLSESPGFELPGSDEDMGEF